MFRHNLKSLEEEESKFKHEFKDYFIGIVTKTSQFGGVQSTGVKYRKKRLNMDESVDQIASKIQDMIKHRDKQEERVGQIQKENYKKNYKHLQ